MKPKQHYRIVHSWLHKHHSKPTQCKNPECSGDGKRFEYALRHGFEHERCIDNYIQLCSKCHRNYDMTEAKGLLAAAHLAGKYNENLTAGPETCKKKVLLISENKIFYSGQDLADYLGCSKSSVYHVLSGKRKSIYGHKVTYADN